jgi:coenzyme PQQ synthesis protein D (PqqD)
VAEATRVLIRCEARGFPFDLYGDAEIERTLTELFVALERREGAPRTVFSIGRTADPKARWEVTIDGDSFMSSEQIGEALHGLMVQINQHVIAARPDLLSIHAAAVATSKAAALLPGSSGSGKTTLCARLLQRGAAYLSDDSVALDANGSVLGYPKALGFKVGTWRQFLDAGLDDLDQGPGWQPVWQIPPSRLGAASVDRADPTTIVVPRFVEGASLRVDPMTRVASATAILEQVQNLLIFGVPAALELIGALVSRCSSHAVIYGDARDAAPAVLDLIEAAESGGAPYQLVPAGTFDGAVSQPHPAAGVTALCFADGALLVKVESGEFAGVDRIGSVVWPLLDGNRSIASIAAELGPLFGAPNSEIGSGLSEWISDLVRRGFLTSPPE